MNSGGVECSYPETESDESEVIETREIHCLIANEVKRYKTTMEDDWQRQS